MARSQWFIVFSVTLVSSVWAASIPRACDSLLNAFPKNVFEPLDSNYDTQTASELDYRVLPTSNTTKSLDLVVWSETCITKPYCVFEPIEANELAQGLKIIVASATRFAVRSGGHMPVPFANGIDDGVLISMSGLNQKKMVENNDIVQIGPGQTWNDVYQYTSPFGKGVAGGRFSPVGVGGLLLGGGLPYFASQVGWSANTVRNYEIVLANGSVIEASRNFNSDLWWALKGGSNNFGIITRYDMETLPITEIYGGTTVYDKDSFQAFLDAIRDYVSPGGGSEDIKAAILPDINIVPATGEVTASLISFYNGQETDPKALEGFAKIPQNFTDNTLHDNFLAYTNLTNLPVYGARNQR